jgi:hypothetical protein
VLSRREKGITLAVVVVVGRRAMDGRQKRGEERRRDEGKEEDGKERGRQG